MFGRKKRSIHSPRSKRSPLLNPGGVAIAFTSSEGFPRSRTSITRDTYIDLITNGMLKQLTMPGNSVPIGVNPAEGISTAEGISIRARKSLRKNLTLNPVSPGPTPSFEPSKAGGLLVYSRHPAESSTISPTGGRVISHLLTTPPLVTLAPPVMNLHMPSSMEPILKLELFPTESTTVTTTTPAPQEYPPVESTTVTTTTTTFRGYPTKPFRLALQEIVKAYQSKAAAQSISAYSYDPTLATSSSTLPTTSSTTSTSTTETTTTPTTTTTTTESTTTTTEATTTTETTTPSTTSTTLATSTTVEQNPRGAPQLSSLRQPSVSNSFVDSSLSSGPAPSLPLNIIPGSFRPPPQTRPINIAPRNMAGNVVGLQDPLAVQGLQDPLTVHELQDPLAVRGQQDPLAVDQTQNREIQKDCGVIFLNSTSCVKYKQRCSACAEYIDSRKGDIMKRVCGNTLVEDMVRLESKMTALRDLYRDVIISKDIILKVDFERTSGSIETFSFPKVRATVVIDGRRVTYQTDFPLRLLDLPLTGADMAGNIWRLWRKRRTF